MLLAALRAGGALELRRPQRSTTREVVQSVGYSGKPLDVLVGLGLDGRLTGAKVVEQHEPILNIGVAEAELEAFVRQYRGLTSACRRGHGLFGETRIDLASYEPRDWQGAARRVRSRSSR